MATAPFTGADLMRTIVSNNTAVGVGGGIWAESVTMDWSTLSGNTATGGGGLLLFGETAVVTNSTISGNHAVGTGFDGVGGAASLVGDAEMTLTNSTVSGNRADRTAGAFFQNTGPLTINHSTITGNRAEQYAGGIRQHTGPLTINSSIIAGNLTAGFPPNQMSPDLNQNLSSPAPVMHFSLVGDRRGNFLVEAPVGTPDANGNLIGGPTNGVIDPLLGALQNNGGLTETHALLSGSPAIDAGDPLAMAGVGDTPLFDQRGTGFDRVANGRIDMGAYELQPSNTVDCDFDEDGDCDIDDIDALITEIAGGMNNLAFDLTGDNLVDLADRDQWLADAGALNLPSGNAYLLGDSNLDGTVNGQDFLAWNANKFMSTGTWSQADWNANGVTDGQDFLIWNGNKFQSSDGPAQVTLPGQSHIPLQTRRRIDFVFASSEIGEEDEHHFGDSSQHN